MYSAVPLFLMISGFFVLGRSVRPNDWGKAKTDFFKYILHYWKWLLVALAGFILVPGLWPGYAPFEGQTLAESAVMVLKNFVNTNLLQGGITSPVALNWFIVGLAWLALLAPLFRPFIQSGNIKMIRTIVFVMLTMACVLPGVRLVAGYILANNPESLAAGFFAVLEPLQPSSFMWDNFWIPAFLLGGWFAVDREAQELIKKMSWTKTITISAALVIVHIVLEHYGHIIGAPDYQTLTSYSKGGWIFITAAYLMIAYKLNFVIREDSRLGRFIINYSSDTLGVMIAGWAFGPATVTGLSTPIAVYLVENFWNPGAPYLLTLVWLAFCIVYFIVVFAAVHLLKKVPFVRGLFNFSELKWCKNHNEKATVSAS